MAEHEKRMDETNEAKRERKKECQDGSHDIVWRWWFSDNDFQSILSSIDLIIES